ncbi:DNA-directed RNA polymerase III subunit RPC7-like isoform X2 [Syngnathus scovelli]|uniref:DNA-directed RNA polymerase III subunit RPC7-like isoform X2 n=1 Tax=Syngnathus scovelli TaxID=161590 RepID=UPI00210F3A1A|nr:DNA-directed RNA polymerase III subunit RPC7-like isoform X2 [Syngnathus scovelli]
MSGCGRGRRGAEGTSVTRGEPLLPSVQQPSPLFPAMELKPLPLTCGEEAEYLLALKQELRGAMGARPGFIQPHAGHRSHADVERYSDKYHNSSEQMDALTNWITGVSGAALRSKRGRADEQKERVKEKQVLLKLETLANEEQRGSEDEEEKKDDDQEVDEEYEEELEEVSPCTNGFYFERSLCVCDRTPITSCPTLTTVKILAPKATTTWTKPFTETFRPLPWQHSDEMTILRAFFFLIPFHVKCSLFTEIQ